MNKSSLENETWETSDRPPKVEDVLVKILKLWRMSHRSPHIPESIFDAAAWWVNVMQGKPDERSDRPERLTDKDGQLAGWRTPYHDRVAGNLRIFLRLPEAHKAFVIDRVKHGVAWRGDDIQMFKMICEQYDVMMQDKGAYIGNASVVLANFKASQEPCATK